jgi:hypothetical protein
MNPKDFLGFLPYTALGSYTKWHHFTLGPVVERSGTIFFFFFLLFFQLPFPRETWITAHLYDDGGCTHRTHSRAGKNLVNERGRSDFASQTQGKNKGRPDPGKGSSRVPSIPGTRPHQVLVHPPMLHIFGLPPYNDGADNGVSVDRQGIGTQ